MIYFLLFFCFYLTYFQVSAVTDQVVGQDTGANGGDLDDDEGGGLVSRLTLCKLNI